MFGLKKKIQPLVSSADGFKVFVHNVSFLQKDGDKFMAAVNEYDGAYSYLMDTTPRLRVDPKTGKSVIIFEIEYFITHENEGSIKLLELATKIAQLPVYQRIKSVNMPEIDPRVNLTPQFA